MKKKTMRPVKRAMMLYVDSEVFALISEKAAAQRPPVKPGPMAAEILKQYFENEQNTTKGTRKKKYQALNVPLETLSV